VATENANGDCWGNELTPKRKMATYISAGVAVVGIVGAISFAVLEAGAESDYEHAPAGMQSYVDDVRARGQRYATLTNVSIALAGIGIAGAVVFGYPMFIKPKAEKPAAPTAMVAPIVAPGMAGAGFAMRF
jgi:hypothetical protein